MENILSYSPLHYSSLLKLIQLLEYYVLFSPDCNSAFFILAQNNIPTPWEILAWEFDWAGIIQVDPKKIDPCEIYEDKQQMIRFDVKGLHAHKNTLYLCVTKVFVISILQGMKDVYPQGNWTVFFLSSTLGILSMFND